MKCPNCLAGVQAKLTCRDEEITGWTCFACGARWKQEDDEAVAQTELANEPAIEMRRDGYRWVAR